MLLKEENHLRKKNSKRLNKIDELSKKIDYGNLKFIVNSTRLETDFFELIDPDPCFSW